MNSTIRATRWSVTINMKNIKRETADHCINEARQKGYKVVGQLEKGQEGTEHYQLMVQTPHIRFSTIKKIFPTAHIEPARNSKALEQYVKKSETRIGTLPEADSSYVTTEKLWDLIYKEFNRCDTDGWDQTNDKDVVLYNEERHLQLVRKPLDFFDKCIDTFIRRGLKVDMLAINPGVRAFWLKFWSAILFRSRATDRQTDRQDDLLSQEVNIPTENEVTKRKNVFSSSEEDSEGDEEGESQTDEGYSTGSGDESCEENDSEEY